MNRNRNLCVSIHQIAKLDKLGVAYTAKTNVYYIVDTTKKHKNRTF